jgi:hypothetical protein
MITVKLMGGLGNQMFQYAYGYALARRSKADAAFDTGFLGRRGNFTARDYELGQFNISINKTCSKDSLIHRILRRVHKSKNYHEGYFQSEKYFADCKEEIRKEFQFKEKLQAPEGNAIAIHIRRGDYVKFANIHLVCTSFYYEKAIAYIQSKVENPVFYVFSEDIEWCKENVKVPEPCFYMDGLDKPSSHDMQLMSLCKHNVISNSSYSWWAAWLNQNADKIIVAPDRWFADGRGTDIYTDDMVRIPAEGER